jgi:hypothetical protein
MEHETSLTESTQDCQWRVSSEKDRRIRKKTKHRYIGRYTRYWNSETVTTYQHDATYKGIQGKWR